MGVTRSWGCVFLSRIMAAGFLCFWRSVRKSYGYTFVYEGLGFSFCLALYIIDTTVDR